jgi:hypothetical protein
MTLPRKRCLVCRCWFEPRAQTPGQKTCSRSPCQKKRHRNACAAWRQNNPTYDLTRNGKKRIWARAFPDYWRRYRAEHPDYCQRDNARRAQACREASFSANQDAWRQMTVERLQGLQASIVSSSANQDACHRRMKAVIDFLVWKELSANRDTIALASRDTGQ